MRNDLDLAIALLANRDRFAEVARASVDLDAVVQEFFKRGQIEDFVVDRVGRVDDELDDAGLFSGQLL